MSIAKKMNYYFKGLKEPPKFVYNTEDIKLFEKYIKENIGDFDKVYHELYSPDVHLDILIIPPDSKNNFYKLVTRGLGAYKMNVPDVIKDEGLDRAELVLYLLPDWNFDFEKQENGWVISQIKNIARTPIMEDSWIGFGHTFSEDEKATVPFASNTKFSSTLLLNALNKEYEFLDLTLPSKDRINFYQIFPLYKEEMLYKQQNGIEALMELFSDEDLIPVVNINRKNYCDDLINKNIEKEEENEIEI